MRLWGGSVTSVVGRCCERLGVEFPAEIADRILAPVDDGRVKTITDRMIALVQLALENEPAIPAQARQEELPMTG
ncbi:MAG: hypothetical protein EOP32_33685 [Rhodococcus sp. (in: high G+C Gram-positive bacteria)]|nr:MAG: hypothetical protein EOP32_33685 [Rhodococcus sp. (in: high G+C Gram-positive bacteria)]